MAEEAEPPPLPLVSNILVVGLATPLAEVAAGPEAAPRSQRSFATTAADRERLRRARFAPELSASYPPDRPFAPGAGVACCFCAPSGLRISVGTAPSPSFASFVLTDEAYERSYGHVLTCHVPLALDTPLAQPEAPDDAGSCGDASAAGEAGAGAAASEQGAASSEALSAMTAAAAAISSAAEPPPLLTVGDLSRGAAVWAPVALCIVSRRHAPLCFKAVLLAVHTLARASLKQPLSLSLETALSHLALAVPLPPPGGPAVRFVLHPELTAPPRAAAEPAAEPESDADDSPLALHVRAPSSSELPSSDYSAASLLDRLRPPQLLHILQVLALEWQLVIVSDDDERRVGAAELFLQWLYPLAWTQAYVPTVPDGPWLDLLKAPFPYIIGLTSRQLGQLPRPLPERLCVLRRALETPGGTSPPPTRTVTAPPRRHAGSAATLPSPAPAASGPSLGRPRPCRPCLRARMGPCSARSPASAGRPARSSTRSPRTRARTTTAHPRLPRPPSPAPPTAPCAHRPMRPSPRGGWPPERRPCPARQRPARPRQRLARLRGRARCGRGRAARLRPLLRLPPPRLAARERGGRGGGRQRRRRGGRARLPAHRLCRHGRAACEAVCVRVCADADVCAARACGEGAPGLSGAGRVGAATQLAEADARSSPPAAQECSDAFLAERVASLSTSRRTPATTAEDLSLSMAARLEARMGGKKSALGGAMGSAAAATAAAAAAAAEAGGKDAAPAAPGACAAFPKGVHVVPPPQSAAAPPPTGFSYPDGPPRSFPESLAPVSSPLPRLKGEPPPPPPAVSAETRRAWAEVHRSR